MIYILTLKFTEFKTWTKLIYKSTSIFDIKGLYREFFNNNSAIGAHNSCPAPTGSMRGIKQLNYKLVSSHYKHGCPGPSRSSS